jgi:hypothetical protein
MTEQPFFKEPGSAGLFSFCGRMFRQTKFLRAVLLRTPMSGGGLSKLTMATKKSMPDMLSKKQSRLRHGFQQPHRVTLVR